MNFIATLNFEALFITIKESFNLELSQKLLYWTNRDKKLTLLEIEVLEDRQDDHVMEFLECVDQLYIIIGT